MTEHNNRRILLIDDNESIHEDFRKILTPEDAGSEQLTDMRAAFLGGSDAPAEPSAATAEIFELSSAFQGEDGYDMLCKACDEGAPFAMAFVDMRMPPGWDGVKTISKLWERDPDLQVVICTAFSDYTWDQTIEILGQSDRLLILKKPFDSIEITMLASALVAKWNSSQREKELYAEAVRSAQEARAYAASLETVNRALVTSKAGSDMALEMRTEFLVQISNEVQLRLAEVLGGVACFSEGNIGDLPDELETVLDVSQRLLETLDEVMDVTALEQGKSNFEAASCSPRSIAEDVVASSTDFARSRGLTLEVVVEGMIPDEFASEPMRLRQILHNLVDNGLRNTEQGGVKLVLKNGRAEDWQRPEFVFEVADTGSGIPHERLGSIFEPFAREHEAGSGYGFGLAISRRLALLLGGDITVRSEVGQGTCFTFGLQYDHVRSTAA